MLLKIDVDCAYKTIIKEIDNDELDKKMTLCWQAHGISVYKARIESCETTFDDTRIHGIDRSRSDNPIDTCAKRIRVDNLTPWLLMVIL